jgi:hypothetical protein
MYCQASDHTMPLFATSHHTTAALMTMPSAPFHPNFT